MEDPHSRHATAIRLSTAHGRHPTLSFVSVALERSIADIRTFRAGFQPRFRAQFRIAGGPGASPRGDPREATPGADPPQMRPRHGQSTGNAARMEAMAADERDGGRCHEAWLLDARGGPEVALALVVATKAALRGGPKSANIARSCWTQAQNWAEARRVRAVVTRNSPPLTRPSPSLDQVRPTNVEIGPTPKSAPLSTNTLDRTRKTPCAGSNELRLMLALARCRSWASVDQHRPTLERI